MAKKDLVGTIGTFPIRAINVPNVPGSDSKIDEATRHKPATSWEG